MGSEIFIETANINHKKYSPAELEEGDIVSAASTYEEILDYTGDLRLVTCDGVYSFHGNLYFKDDDSKTYYKVPAGTVIKLVVK